MSLLSYALATCDAHILYRLIGQKVDPATWAGIFGGGCKKVLQVATAPNKAIPRQPVSFLEVPFKRNALGLRPKNHMILIEKNKEVCYLKKNSQTPQEKNRENLNRSNTYGQGGLGQ